MSAIAGEGHRGEVYRCVGDDNIYVPAVGGDCQLHDVLDILQLAHVGHGTHCLKALTLELLQCVIHICLQKVGDAYPPFFRT